MTLTNYETTFARSCQYLKNCSPKWSHKIQVSHVYNMPAWPGVEYIQSRCHRSRGQKFRTVLPIGHCCTTARAQHLDMSRCSGVTKFCPLVVKLLPTCCQQCSCSGVCAHGRSAYRRLPSTPCQPWSECSITKVWGGFFYLFRGCSSVPSHAISGFKETPYIEETGNRKG